MFVYCGNNPVGTKDTNGEFWHIVVGAAVGAMISGGMKIVTNLAEGNEWSDGVLVAAAFGGLSGALGASGVGVGLLVAGNVAISMAENATEQLIDINSGENSTFDFGNMLLDGAISGAFAYWGAPHGGSGSKHMTNLGKQTVRRTINSMKYNSLRESFLEMQKAAKYYCKSTASYYRDVAEKLVPDFLMGAGQVVMISLMLR